MAAELTDETAARMEELLISAGMDTFAAIAVVARYRDTLIAENKGAAQPDEKSRVA